MTTTEICNQALSHLGEARITDFHEASVVAEKCRIHFDQTRDSLLRMHRWNFAEKAAELSALSDAPLFGYSRQFQLPSDLLRLLELNGVEASMAESRAWRIQGKKLLTNDAVARVIYISRVEDTREFDPVFVDAFAYKLAADLAVSINTSHTDRNNLLGIFQSVMRDAGWADAVETRPRVIPAWTGSPALRSRFSGGRHYGRTI